MKTILLAEIRMRTFQSRDYGKLRCLIPYTAQILMFIGLFAVFFQF